MNFIKLNAVQADGAILGLTFATSLLSGALFLNVAKGTQISFPNGLPTLIVTEATDAILALLDGSVVTVSGNAAPVV